MPRIQQCNTKRSARKLQNWFNAMTRREYPEYPMIGVGVVILGPDGILLIKRGNPPRQGSWSLPGGRQKLGETVETCAQREVQEETGLNVSLIGLIDVINSIQPDDHDRIRYHYTLTDFAATVEGGALQPGSDAMDARWFCRQDIAKLELWSETERVIDLAIEMYETLNPGSMVPNVP